MFVNEFSVLVLGFLDGNISFAVLKDLDLVVDLEMEANLLIS